VKGHIGFQQPILCWFLQYTTPQIFTACEHEAAVDLG
jgi:hypothetical protein